MDLFFILKNISVYFVWWVFEINRMFRSLDIKQNDSITFQGFNVKHLMSSTVQKYIKLEMVRCLLPVQK